MILDLVEHFKSCGVETLEPEEVTNPIAEWERPTVYAQRDTEGIVRWSGGASAHHCGDMWMSPSAVHCLECCKTFKDKYSHEAHRANNACVNPCDAGMIREPDPVWGSPIYRIRKGGGMHEYGN